MKKYTSFLGLGAIAGISLAMTLALIEKPIDKLNFNAAVRPQDDFYEYVNGTWLKNNPIPATESSWSNFNALDEKSRKAQREICENAAANNTAKEGTNEQKIGAFYASGMDTIAIEAEKFNPLKAQLDMIDGIKSKADYTTTIARLHQIQVSAPFGVYVMADLKNSVMNAVYMGQSGMGLPEKDFYMGDAMESYRKAYREHIMQMFLLLGDNKETADRNASDVLDIETSLASGAMSAVEQRDAEKQYNVKNYDQLKELAPNIDWATYFNLMGLARVEQYVVTQPTFMISASKLMDVKPVESWKAYFRWHLIHSFAGYLHKPVADENFRFYGTFMSGAKKQQPRWKRVLRATDGALGEAIGQEYVKKHFSEESKKRVNEMVNNLIAAYEERINQLPWMGPETKKAAKQKLAMITRKLGFPDKWRDYSGLTVNRTSYLGNILASNRFDMEYMLGKANEKVDKAEWGMTPATVNAYYNPTNNEIVFPAAIMQPPFFNADADDAVNYGAMGAVIGHELTHGFDDEGSHFDGEGNLVEWWQETDRKQFNERTAKLVNQFNNFVAVDSLKLTVNGELTLGENIADLGGLTIAYYAFKRSLQGKKDVKKIDGFTPEQRFFISWAQGWRNNMRPGALINMVKTNPHAPAKFRVIGPLSNMKEFYEAFGVKESDKMFRKPEERVEIW
jgi:putative endopeptidase